MNLFRKINSIRCLEFLFLFKPMIAGSAGDTPVKTNPGNSRKGGAQNKKKI